MATARILGTAVLVLVAGCQRPHPPPLGAVTGVVTLDGEPLAGALVLFTPEGPGRSSQGLTDAAGRYALVYLRDIMGADLGRHRVRITTCTDEGGDRELLPARYHAATELSAEVRPGDNRCDFPLTAR